MVNQRFELEKEAKQISRYLIGKECTGELAQRYVEAHQKLKIELLSAEEFLWEKALKSRFWMACVDSGLAFIRPKSQIRRKIFVMLALLEASVDYCDEFLSEKKSRFFMVVYLIRQGIMALFFAVVGVVFIKIYGDAKAI